MMTSQILKFVDSSKALKSKYLENKKFFLQIKFTYYGLRDHMFLKIPLAEVTFEMSKLKCKEGNLIKEF